MIPKFNKGLLGLAKFENSEFRPEDSEERYQNSLKTQPADWIYRTEKIIYQTNSYGHRCDEIDKLEDDYFLFTGCSFTEGVGLPLEKTYPYLVSKHFNKTYYNLGVGGTGADFAAFNLIGFISLAKKRPSAIIIQWPDFHRFFNFNEKFEIQTFLPHMFDNNIYKILTEENIPLRQNIFHRQFVLQYLENLGFTRIIEFGHQPEMIKVNNIPIIPMPQNVDFARDLSHYGIETHKIWANSIIDELKKN